ncbi:hypothetical protein [Lactococcus lactis]|uniref:hypothetical protein n=1 Tax=Lactococcus lactis TaxID=1358 RepID=UPI003D27035C
MTQETAKEHLYSKLNEVKTNHDKALNVYGTQTMNEVLKIVDSYFENLPSTTDKLSVEKLQEQLNTAKKALTEIIFFSQGCYDSEYFASIAKKALAAIGGDDD